MTQSVRIAAIGIGRWGQNIVRVLAEQGLLHSVVDVDPARASATAEQHGVPALELADVLADPSVGAVSIAAPAARHFELTRTALAAGKHCFVEKPLAMTVADAQYLVTQAEAAGLTLMVGHLMQYHSGFRELQRLVEGGELGRLRYLYSNRLNFGQIRREEDTLWSFAPHDLSMILTLVGEQPTSVSAVGANYLHDRIADVTTTHLSFASGVRAHIFVSWLHPFKEQKLVVVGDQAMASLDDGQPWDRKLAVYPHQITWKDGSPAAHKSEPSYVALDPNEPLHAELEHFAACCRTGARPRTDGAEAVRVLEVLAKASADLDNVLAAPDSRPPGVQVHPTAEIDPDVEIGPGSKIWHFSHILSGSRIGSGCSFGQNTMVGPDVTVGNGCKVQNNVSLYAGVEIGDDVFIGPSAVFTNVTNPRAAVNRKDEFARTRVERGATIGANATIVCGTTLGEYSFVAAGAVVTKDVPPHALVAGVPARQIGWVSHAGEVLDDTLTCPRTGQRYEQDPATGALSSPPQTEVPA
jgi:UDP-2-acetamido-3-amino-2,3-dideoxy-glucuronate N-acetyltransferase